MNILFLPSNIASQQAITSGALNQIDGVTAKCLTKEVNKYNSIPSSLIFIPEPSLKLYNPYSIYQRIRYRRDIKKWIKWADVLHYVWGPALKSGLDLKWAKQMRKPIFVEWVGSDIRNPGILSLINSFYKAAFLRGYEYKELENSNYKDEVQSLFSSVKAIPTLSPEMSLYLRKDLFPNYVNLPHRINIADYIPVYPILNKSRPLIIHSPTARIGKGSDIIITVIQELQLKYEFDFILLHDKPRNEVLSLLEGCDIFIDQIIVGGYGMASCEAMAFGKPVINYIIPEVFEAGLPTDCPIINTNAEDLNDNLIKLIESPSLRLETGQKSRAFVESYNDANKIAVFLCNIYKDALSNKIPKKYSESCVA